MSEINNNTTDKKNKALLLCVLSCSETGLMAYRQLEANNRNHKQRAYIWWTDWDK